MSQDNPSYSGCSIDIAVNEDETFLLEMNDGYSLGLYDQMPVDLYVELILNRWKHFFV